MGRGLGVGVGRGGTVVVGVAVAVGVGVNVAVAVGVGVNVAVAVGVGEPPPQPPVPFMPMEKSLGWPCSAVFCQLAPKKLLLKNAFRSLPQGCPTQLAPLVVESKERPLRSPTTVTLSQ